MIGETRAARLGIEKGYSNWKPSPTENSRSPFLCGSSFPHHGKALYSFANRENKRSAGAVRTRRFTPPSSTFPSLAGRFGQPPATIRAAAPTCRRPLAVRGRLQNAIHRFLTSAGWLGAPIGSCFWPFRLFMFGYKNWSIPST